MKVKVKMSAKGEPDELKSLSPGMKSITNNILSKVKGKKKTVFGLKGK